MASALPLSAIADLVASHISAADKVQFRALWNDHLKMRGQGKIVYFIPRDMGGKMGSLVLEDIATKLGYLTSTQFSIHYDPHKSCYRIGQVFDQLDMQYVRKCILIFQTERQGRNVNPSNSTIQLNAFTNFFVDSYYKLDSASSPAMSGKNATALAKKLPKISKPRNMWIIYRQDKHNIVLADNPGMHTSNISTIIANMWHNESDEVKAHYEELAKQEKLNHQFQHPGYKCSPRKASQIKKRKRTRKTTFINIQGDLATMMSAANGGLGTGHSAQNTLGGNSGGSSDSQEEESFLNPELWETTFDFDVLVPEIPDF